MADEQSLPLYRGASAVFRGWFAAKNGDIVSGIELVRRGTTAYRATGADLWGPFFDALLAEACEIAGRYEEAAQLLHDAELTVEGRGARWFVAELNRRQGRLLYRQGCLEAAEQLHRKAMSIATQQEARLWELRAATSLARLWGDKGRRAEMREMLTPIYSRFAEGFDTADLREAKTVLDALA